MKHRAFPIGLGALSLAISLSSVVWGSRMERSNSLSECIAKADTIVLGFVDAKEDQGGSGVIKVRVLTPPLKGKVGQKEISITDPFFRSGYGGSPEGPIVVEQKNGYLFFLANSSSQEYRLFDSYDGVINASNPVTLEIRNQVQQQQTK